MERGKGSADEQERLPYVLTTQFNAQGTLQLAEGLRIGYSLAPVSLKVSPDTMRCMGCGSL